MLALRVPVFAPTLKEACSPCYEARHAVRATCFRAEAGVSDGPINGLNMPTMLE